MILDQFPRPNPMHFQPIGCIECGKPMRDLSRWDASNGRITIWRCVSKDCCLSIFQPVHVPTFAQSRIL